jgi:ABC-type multidrug transport system fused ATPase/permease subunit
MAIILISLQRLNSRFIGIARAISNLAEFTPRLNRTIYLLKTEKFKFRRTGGKDIKLNLKKIEFSRVNFQYSKTANFNLKNINFSLKSGETTAIVGLSGSGKSSILDLLIGLFEPNSGEIFIDGVNLKDLNLINWQKKVSIVNQDPFLLNDTIINNIKFGLENVTLTNIKNACIQSGAYEFIENLPNSYNTIIGERGFKLSGGQRQRISIARALLKNSSLLILDEATSALDSKNELLIKDNISKISQKKITLIVAHRLSTIKDADNILVLNNGEIVERGDHNSLLNQNQIYTKLWNIQSKS